MSDYQAPAGWYPDGTGSQRFWDGAQWTDQIQEVPDGANASQQARPSAYSRLKKGVASAQADRSARRAADAEAMRLGAERAGALATSGVFGATTIEIYAHGYVRIFEARNETNPIASRLGTAKAPFEKLISIRYTGPGQESPSDANPLGGAAGPVIAGLMKGGAGLVKASGPGIVLAGANHVVSAKRRKSYLTVTTDKQIHTLTNEDPAKFLPRKEHDEVGIALAAAGTSVLGAAAAAEKGLESTIEVSAGLQPVASNDPAPSAGDRLRELAELHREGILSDDEFSQAKARVIGGL